MVKVLDSPTTIQKVILFVKNSKTILILLVLTVGTLITLQQLFYAHDVRQRAAETLLSITDFGATPNDNTDDTAAINNAISAAQAQGKTVYVPPGTFNHTSFTLNGVHMTGAGSTSILYATVSSTNPSSANSSIILTGNNPSLTNLTVQVYAAQRVGTNVHSVWADNATNYTISGILVNGSGDSGIFSRLSSYGTITNNIVENTKADGIHNTKSSHDLYIGGNTVKAVGDDAIAVVSYNDGNCPVDLVKNVLIENNDVGYQSQGRGISVVGGQDVTIRSNKINNTLWAGLYITAEGSYNTCGVSNIRVENNTLDTTATSTNHPATLLYADSTGQSIQNVLISGNTISNNPKTSGIQVRNVSNNIAIINNIITNTASGVTNDTTSGNIYCLGNTFNGNLTPLTPCGGVYNFVVTGSSVVAPTPTPTSGLINTPTPTQAPILTPTPTTVPTATDTVAPTVTIVSPANGSSITTRSLAISATASDNVGVTKVNIYIDGTLKVTDTSSPYTYTWNTKKVSSGAHTIRAVAYDAANNSSYQQITVYK